MPGLRGHSVVLSPVSLSADTIIDDEVAHDAFPLANVAFYCEVVVPPALFRRYEFNAQFQYAAVSFQAGVFQAVSEDAPAGVSVEFVFPGYAYVGHAGFFRCVVEPGSQPGTVAVDVVEFVVGSVYFCVEAVQVQPTVFEVAVEHVVGVV